MGDSKIQSVIEHNYVYKAAGQEWRVGDVTFLTLPDGSRSLPYSEIRRLNSAVAKKLKVKSKLTESEESFLSDWDYDNST